jgi:ribosome recycling factor
MDSNKIIEEFKKKSHSAVEHFQEELKKLRTGRAHASMLDGIVVQAYGVAMPLVQLASISVPEPQLLQITPFDPSNIQAIATAIRNNQTLGLNPTDDGRVIRVPIPALTEDRRRDLVKQIGEKVETCMITLRNARHDSLKSAELAKKDKTISEDEFKRIEKQVDELMSSQRQNIERLASSKETDVMTV